MYRLGFDYFNSECQAGLKILSNVLNVIDDILGYLLFWRCGCLDEMIAHEDELDKDWFI